MHSTEEQPSKEDVRHFCGRSGAHCELLMDDGSCWNDIIPKRRETARVIRQLLQAEEDVRETEKKLSETLGMRRAASFAMQQYQAAITSLRHHGWNNQERSVARGVCEKASVDGKSGTMTVVRFTEGSADAS